MILDAAIQVHRRVGPRCLESVYAPCLAIEFQKRRLEFAREIWIPLHYDDLHIPHAYRPDFIVEGCIVAELKSGAEVTSVDERQVDTYLILTGCPLGLLLNCGRETLKDGIRRRVNNFPYGSPPYSSR
jgi:GxxExxY protein